VTSNQNLTLSILQSFLFTLSSGYRHQPNRSGRFAREGQRSQQALRGPHPGRLVVAGTSQTG